MKYRLAAMIMAAGESSRFGSCKHLASLAGSTVLQQVVDVANSCFENSVYVVTGRYHDEIQKNIQHAKFIINSDWKDGLGKSIAVGVNHLASSYDGLMIILGDQVAITTTHLQLFAKAFDDEKITCAFYNGQNGVPALFPKSRFHSLQCLNGPQGAKSLLNRADVSINSIAMNAAAIDIDTRDQLLKINQQRNSGPSNPVSGQPC